MKRKDFFKRVGLVSVASVMVPSFLFSKNKDPVKKVKLPKRHRTWLTYNKEDGSVWAVSLFEDSSGCIHKQKERQNFTINEKIYDKIKQARGTYDL